MFPNSNAIRKMTLLPNKAHHSHHQRTGNECIYLRPISQDKLNRPIGEFDFFSPAGEVSLNLILLQSQI